MQKLYVYICKVRENLKSKILTFHWGEKKLDNLKYYYNFLCFKSEGVFEFFINVQNFLNKSYLYISIKEKIINFDKKYLKVDKVENTYNNFSKNSLVKQNKALTKYEFLSYAITSGSNRSYFYSPLHSFLPLFISGVMLSLLIIMVALFFRDIKIENKTFIFFIFIFSLAVSLSFWFSKFYIEKKTGRHIDFIRQNIVFGFYLFIMTEGLCFLALFWTFLHSTLAASIHIGVFNPGEGVVNFYVSEAYRIGKNWNIYYYNTFGTPGFYNVSTICYSFDPELFSYGKVKTHVNLFDSGSLINPWKLPFINTLILLSSAASLNASHCYILLSRYFSCLVALCVTIIFGILFVFMQFKEYKNCSLNYNDGIYPSCFFGITGLHGIHVILGILALTVCLFNIFFKNFSPNFHQTFYFSIFYWHFVDIIWIAVWLIIYLWPGSYFFTSQYLSCYSEDFFIYNMNTGFFLNLVDYNAWEVFYAFDMLIYENSYEYKTSDLAFSDLDFKANVDYNDMCLFEFNAQTEKFNKESLNLFFNIEANHNVLFEKYDIEFDYGYFLENSIYFNFNLLKKSILYYCWFMTEIHDEMVLSVYCPVCNDIENKYIRWTIYLFMHLFLPRYLRNIYLNFFFSPWYMYNID